MSALKQILFFIFLLVVTAQSIAQQWKRNRKEVFFGLGATNFLGELGGANAIGTDAPSLKAIYKDLEVAMTRPLVGIGYRYTLRNMQRVRGSLHWGMLSGNDNLTTELFRNNRNLHFRSGVVELSAGFEQYLNQEAKGHRYNIKGARGKMGKNFSSYAFGGVGLLYFNPKALYNGKWTALQPLSTEGQGILPGTKKYSRITVCVPFGLGLKYSVSRDWKIGLEIGLRKTFTDYIDDVSTVYYDKAEIRAKKGDAAAYLADPSLTGGPGPMGGCQTCLDQQRGDPKDKDAYMFGLISVNYRLTRRGARAKF